MSSGDVSLLTIVSQILSRPNFLLATPKASITMKFTSSSAVLVLSLISGAAEAAITKQKARGQPQGKKDRASIHNERRQLSHSNGRGSKGGSLFDEYVDVYSDDPPVVEVSPGATINSCAIKLTNDLDCTGEFDCLNLMADDGDTVLDCDGHTIDGHNSDASGLVLGGIPTTKSPVFRIVSLAKMSA
jgi:hypothetical protein